MPYNNNADVYVYAKYIYELMLIKTDFNTQHLGRPGFLRMTRLYFVWFNSISAQTRATLRRAVWVEANLPGTFTAYAIFYSKCIARRRLILKMKVKITKYCIHSGAIWWRISTSEYCIHSGAIWWRISTSAKVIWHIFAIAVAVSVMLTSNLWTWKFRSRSRSATFAMIPFNGKYQTL